MRRRVCRKVDTTKPSLVKMVWYLIVSIPDLCTLTYLILNLFQWLKNINETLSNQIFFYDFTFLCRCWNNPAEHVQCLYNTSTYLDDEGYVDDIATLYQVSSLAHTSLEQTLRPKSAAIVSSPNHSFFLGKLEQAVNQ